MAKVTRTGALILMIPLFVLSAQAAPRQARAKVTGADLVRDMLADPFVNDLNHIRRERAMGYIDGVMDSSSGLRWCPAGKSVPHELNYLVIEKMSTMPAAQLNGSAAELVLVALAHLLPCKVDGAKP